MLTWNLLCVYITNKLVSIGITGDTDTVSVSLL